MYRGYFLDISAVAERKDFSALEKALQGQINMVEETNLSPRVLQFFHTVPIKVDEFACLDGAEAVTDEAPPDSEKKLKPKKPVQAWACYHESDAPGILPGNFSGVQFGTVKSLSGFQPSQTKCLARVDLADYEAHGVVMFRLQGLDPNTPVLLHELLHAFHAQIMPDGFNNKALQSIYEQARGLYPDEAYLMSNAKEFFAMTASAFLHGEVYQEPFTRAKVKEKQPDYYKYLVWLFGDPEGTPKASPVAAAD